MAEAVALIGPLRDLAIACRVWNMPVTEVLAGPAWLVDAAPLVEGAEIAARNATISGRWR